MKRKFLILTLCFTIIFSSVNLKKVDAIDFVISPTILAVVSTLAVGTGIALKNSDDIYDIGRIFYDYVESNNELTWDIVKTTFESAKVLNDTILINSGILDITKGFFDSKFKNNNSDISFTYNGSLPYFQDFESVLKYSSSHYDFIGSDYYGKSFKSQGLDFKLKAVIDTSSVPYSSYEVYFGEEKLFKFTMYGGSSSYLRRKYTLYTYKYSDTETRIGLIRDGDTQNASTTILNADFLRIFGGVGTLPYNGGYDWDTNVEDKKEGTGDLPLPIPGNLGDLVGKNPSDIWDKNYENGLVGNGNLSIPGVDNPSIGIGGSTSFPNVGVENPPTDIPGVENPPVGVIPPFPSFGNSLDFSPMYLTNINEKFPFSLPWDIGRLIEKFDIEPKAPIFKVPILTSEIELDLTIFDEWANIVRFFVLIGFVLSLILISTKLLG